MKKTRQKYHGPTLFYGFILVCMVYVFASNSAYSQDWDTTEIHSLLKYLVDENKQGTGIVVGLLDDSGAKIVAYGKTSTKGTPVDGDTVYEIGSISKVFTGLLLSDMVVKSTLTLDDPVQNYLPDSVTLPKRGGQQITFRHLSQHSSGLPRMPDNFAPKDPLNPYADYTVEQMYAFLAGHELRRDIGQTVEYSNVGVGLLGHTLAEINGQSYETLVTNTILKPLNMDRTTITLTEEIKSNLAVPHAADLTEVSMWDLPTFAGAGALRSSANDMLKFLAANLEMTKNPLTDAIAYSHSQRRSADQPNMEIALNWFIRTEHGTEVYWHNGGTGGYRSFAGFNKAKNIGVVVLNNSENSLDELGFHLLDAEYPNIQIRNELEGDQFTQLNLDKYTGQYQLAPKFILNITHEEGQLWVQASGQPKFPMFPESKSEFFLKVINASATFVPNEFGGMDHLIWHQGGRDQKAPRKGDARPPRVAVELEEKLLREYVGEYNSPTLQLTISMESGELYGELMGQKFKLYAESATDFFVKETDAQFSFKRDSNAVTGTTLYQGPTTIQFERDPQ